MLGLLYAALFVLMGCAGFSFSQRKTGSVKGWQMKNGDMQMTLASLDTIQLSTLFLSIILKYVPFTRGYNAKLKVNKSKDGFDLPVVNLHGPIIVTEDDIETFNIAVSRRFKRSTSKADDQINPLFFTSICTPVILQTLASHACPIKPLGAVNTGNSFTFEDVKFCRDPKAILEASNKRQLTYSSKFGGSEMQAFRRKRGIETDVVIDVKKEDSTVLKIRFSFLQFLPKKHLPLYKEEQEKADNNTSESNEKQSSSTPLLVSRAHPHKWAASCSDYNPIHVSPLAAKFFGFSSTIAHGNHVVALAVQDSLEDAQKGSAGELLSSNRFSLQVKFVKPMLLPADLKVIWKAKSQSSMALEIQNKEGKPCVIGDLEA